MKRKIPAAPGLIAINVMLIFGSLSFLTAQTENQMDFSQYLFSSFEESTIITKTGKAINIILNYNTVSEKLVFEQNGQYFDLTNPETVVTAIIEKREFIPFGTVFLEVIISDQISLYIQNRSELVAPGRPTGYGQTSQLTSSNVLSGVQTPSGYYNFKLPDGYTVRPASLYWIKVKEEMHSFLGEKQFLRIFPDESDKLKQFIRKNRIKLNKTEDLIRLVSYLNELNK